MTFKFSKGNLFATVKYVVGREKQKVQEINLKPLLQENSYSRKKVLERKTADVEPMKTHCKFWRRNLQVLESNLYFRKQFQKSIVKL